MTGTHDERQMITRFLVPSRAFSEGHVTAHTAVELMTMNATKFILGLAGAAALTIPYAASAQQYYGQPYYGDQPYYGQSRGDYYRGWSWGQRFAGYPGVRGEEEHIRREIWESVREDMIAPDDARELMQQLRRIQWHEQREFQVHGWNLPDDDRQRIRFELDQFDRQVDQIRQEP